MAYVRKTKDVWDIMTNYGYGWEAESPGYESLKEAKEDARWYLANTSADVVIRHRRERIEN